MSVRNSSNNKKNNNSQYSRSVRSIIRDTTAENLDNFRLDELTQELNELEELNKLFNSGKTEEGKKLLQTRVKQKTEKLKKEQNKKQKKQNNTQKRISYHKKKLAKLNMPN